jgi:hypothetical protein
MQRLVVSGAGRQRVKNPFIYTFPKICFAEPRGFLAALRWFPQKKNFDGSRISLLAFVNKLIIHPDMADSHTEQCVL